MWVPLTTRDEIVGFVDKWSAKTEIAAARLLRLIGLGKSKFHAWRHRQGIGNRHNSQLPRSSWLAQWERQAIIEAYRDHRSDGYRRLAYNLLDIGKVCVSPSTV